MALKAVLNGFFWDFEATGSGQYLRWLVQYLEEIEGLELIVLKPRAGGEASTGRSGRRTSNLAKVLWEQYGFPRQAGRRTPHLVHVPYFAPTLIPPAPQIVTVHDIANLVLPEYRGTRLLRLYFALAKLGLRRSVHVITDSEAARREIIRVLKVPPHRVTSVLLGVDPTLRPLEPDHPGIAEVVQKFGLKRPFFLYLGGYDARKNLPTLVEAYAHLVSLGTDWRLVIAGQWPQRWGTSIVPDLPAVILRHGLEQRVTLTGRVSADERLFLLNAASAFVFPSSYEGFGLPPLEAMACGLPVIAGQAEAVQEVCGDAALYVAPRSVPELVQAMHRVATDPELRTRLAQAGLLQAKRYTWAATAKATAEVYFEVASRHAGASGK